MLNNILYLSAYADLPNEIFIRQLYYWYIKVMNTDYIFKNKLIDKKNLLLDIVILSLSIIIFFHPHIYFVSLVIKYKIR